MSPDIHCYARLSSCGGLLVCLIGLSCAAQSEQICNKPTADVRVGAATVNIQADDSMYIAGGIGPALSKGQEGELRAVAVVVQKPEFATVAIVACDVLFTPRDIVAPALAEIERTTGLPPDHVLVSATHTHHAPSTTKIHGYDREEVFCQRLQQAIVKSVQDACGQLADNDASFYFHLGEESTVGANSRLLLDDGKIHWIGSREHAVRPTGPFDPQLPVLAFHSGDGTLRAVIYNHSTHTIGTRRPGVRSPSFYGLAAQELEQELGRGKKTDTVVSFLEGASGSTHNITGVSMPAAIQRMKGAVTDGLAKAQHHPVRQLRSIKRPFTFRVRDFDEATEDEKVVTYVRKYAPSIADKTIDIFREMRHALKPDQGQSRETVIQTIVIGDVALVGVPAEYFTSLGVDIKKRSPFRYTYIAELANDWIGYLPDREAHGLGGYQTWMGFHSFAEPGTGERMADDVIAMLNELASKEG
jgi:hypothetical protein